MIVSTCSGAQARARFFEAMKAVAIGAQLTRGGPVWTVVDQKRRDTSIDLTIRRGRRTFLVAVPVCHYGPLLHQVGLSRVKSAPVQIELIAKEGGPE